MAGICLAPEHGYVFVTFIYRDDDLAICNNIIRFQTTPETFSIKPASQVAFTEIFLGDESGAAHQIGICQTNGEVLYVGVGDGWKPAESQEIDSTLGKTLRMTLDGEPIPENPFYQDDFKTRPENYVWSYGHRNPFGLKLIEDRLFVAENGLDSDRFLEVEEGGNYLWDGTDLSIGTNALAVFSKALAPVQVDYYSGDRTAFPEDYDGSFFIAPSGRIRCPGLAEGEVLKGILKVDYNLTENRVTNVPDYILEYRGSGFQAVVGVGFGADGLYFLPLFPDEEGTSAVFNISHEPENEHPHIIDSPNTEDSQAYSTYLNERKGCSSCHSINGRGGNAAPQLDRDPLIASVEARMNSEQYLQLSRAVSLFDRPPYDEFEDARTGHWLYRE